MEKLDNLYEKVISLDNLRLADRYARKGKRKSYGVLKHDRNREENIHALHAALSAKTFRTSVYRTFKIYEPKERLIYRLNYYPDRIVHHAVMNVMEPIWMGLFSEDTYSCIKGRGIHAAVEKMKKAVRSSGSDYCLKIDIKKYYPSIDHDVLKEILRRKIKDGDLLDLLDEIIGSAPGVPIGNYLSQYFANLYLAYFDHFVKNELKIKYYFRYADDMVFLSDSKEELWDAFRVIKTYMSSLKLTIKDNVRVFPTRTGIDFIGYVFFPTHTRLRKSIKKRMFKSIKRHKNHPEKMVKTLASYQGWMKHCDAINLQKKVKHEIEQN